MKSLIRFLSSVKLAIFLIIIITAASMIGTFIPQLRSAEEYGALYGQLSELLIRLEITDLYHSWWFIALLFLFSLNIVICTLTRLAAKFRRAFKPNLEFENQTLLAAKIQDRFSRKGNLEKSEGELKKGLRSAHYKIKETRKEAEVHLLARKKILGIFGSDIVHLGLLVILIGGIISGFSGFRTNINISEGEIVPVLGADFKLQLDKFETEYHPNGSVKDWKSTLTVMEDDNPRLTKTIEVNHPLTYKGYVFYQSSYGWDWQNPTLEIWAIKTSDPSSQKNAFVRLGEKVIWDEENLEFKALQFLPDFIIDGNQPRTRSLNPNNPAVFIEVYRGEDKISSGWIFAKFPDFSQMHSEEEADYKFEFKDIQTSQYSGIQMAKDPGVNYIWVGCTLLMIGLFLAFYWPPRDIRLILMEKEGKTEIISAGRSAKSKLALESEFKRIMVSFRRSQ
ncbi:MAG: cytochrome c biogenesis protein ResB [Candidatus Aminicenantes bacterium]|nr:MAG: cytochrome c biogenesis protein ResB [Candidatus Aminicenantes bacterium]